MPTIYQYFGILFRFFSEDHLPVHVHAIYNSFQNKLVFIYKNGKLSDIEVKKVSKYEGLPPAQLRDAIAFAKKYEKDINDRWNDFFVRHKKVPCIKITKKI